METAQYNELSSQILRCAIEVHRNLGPGLLESTYEKCLVIELKKAGLKVDSQCEINISYKENVIEKAYFIDLVVENVIVLELKSVETILSVHKSQLLTYMKLGDYKLGLLLNFNVSLMKEGVVRMVNKL